MEISIGEYTKIICNCSSTKEITKVKELFNEFIDNYSEFEIIIVNDQIRKQQNKLHLL